MSQVHNPDESSRLTAIVGVEAWKAAMVRFEGNEAMDAARALDHAGRPRMARVVRADGSVESVEVRKIQESAKLRKQLETADLPPCACCGAEVAPKDARVLRPRRGRRQGLILCATCPSCECGKELAMTVVTPSHIAKRRGARPQCGKCSKRSPSPKGTGERPLTCRRCGSALVKPHTGRTPAYCSERCRHLNKPSRLDNKAHVQGSCPDCGITMANYRGRRCRKCASQLAAQKSAITIAKRIAQLVMPTCVDCAATLPRYAASAARLAARSASGIASAIDGLPRCRSCSLVRRNQRERELGIGNYAPSLPPSNEV